MATRGPTIPMSSGAALNLSLSGVMYVQYEICYSKHTVQWCTSGTFRWLCQKNILSLISCKKAITRRDVIKLSLEGEYNDLKLSLIYSKDKLAYQIIIKGDIFDRNWEKWTFYQNMMPTTNWVVRYGLFFVVFVWMLLLNVEWLKSDRSAQRGATTLLLL